MGLYGGPSAPFSPYGTSSFATEPRAGLTGPRQVAPRAPAAPTGGYSFTTALRNDPFLRAQLAGINAQGTTAQGNLDAQRSTLLAQYGAVPQNVGFNPTQETRDLAQQATQGGVSTVAQLQRAYEQQQAGDAAAAAARGLGHSGFVGQFTNQNLTGYQQQQYNALNQLLGQLGQAQSTYQQQQAQLRGQTADQTNQALMRLIARINAGNVG